MNTLVMKFGGSAVGTTSTLTQVVSIVLQEHERWDSLILVVSALDGVTDALIEAAQLAQFSNRRGYRRIVATIRTRHLALIDELPLGKTERAALQADIDRLLFDMLDICQSLADLNSDNIGADKLDAIVGVGERLTARIVAALLRQNKLRGVAVEGNELIITDETYGNATPDIAMTSRRIRDYIVPMLSRDIVPVVTGYIAETSGGQPTTLGRGGSDFTASLVSVATGAKEVWMWTDVDGMMSADPRDIPEASVIQDLSYEEVAELSYFGARILHPRMIDPLQKHNIPLRVKNIFKPQQAGTLIHALDSASRPVTVKAVTAIYGISVRTKRTQSLANISQRVDSVLADITGNRSEVMISSQSSHELFAAFVLPTSAGTDAVHNARDALIAYTKKHFELEDWSIAPVVIITIVGSHLNGTPAILSRILTSADDIEILAISQGASPCSISLVVHQDDADSALQRLHTLVS